MTSRFRCVLWALVLTVCGGWLPAAGQRPVWQVEKAWREATPTRERVSINGLWRWQPAESDSATVPSGGWGYLRVPEPWPGGSVRSEGTRVFHPLPGWDRKLLAGLKAAWHQREITVPAGWSSRRITLSAEYVNSFAAVYVDGVKAGELRYPQGEVDLTAVCRPGRTYLLSLLVVAMPLKAVMLSYNDTAAAKQVTGSVARRGLCGDVWLAGTPAGARVAEVKVETSTRRWQLTVNAAFEGLRPAAGYTLRAVVRDGARAVKEFSRPLAAADVSRGRVSLAEPWRPEKLWDLHTPGNQYTLDVSLGAAGGRLLDQALPVRFGFREFWIDGRDFYLNGTRVWLSAIPLDNAQESPARASYETTRATLQRFKSFGINFVYTHNYGCEPGAHLSFEEVLRAADDEGVLLSFSQPHFGHYDWTAPDADAANGYARHAEFFTRVAGSHPSVVFYSTSHNATGYSEDMNPDLIDGVHDARDPWGQRNAARAVRAEAIIRKLDGSRIVYHHSSGNLGAMHTSNFYGNWIPIQEMSDWFAHWATNGVKPLFTCEYSVPFLWDWAMYRGWYKGKREFGSAEVPWEFAVAEWDAQFLGPRAYRIGEDEKKNLRWEAARFRKGGGWKRWDYPQSLNSQAFDDRFEVVAMHLADNWRAFRAWGVSATSPWDYGSYWKRPAAAEPAIEIDWDRLQRPGPRPAAVNEAAVREQLAFRPSDWQPTAAAAALYRNNMPLLGSIAGKPAAFTGKDHIFVPGETVEKQLIAINNSRATVNVEARWSLGLPRPISGGSKFPLATGEQKRLPVRFDLPSDLAPGRYELTAEFRFAGGETQRDGFTIDVIARPPGAPGEVVLFDPAGETARLLDRLGVRYRRVDAGAESPTQGVLVIGKGALSVSGPAPGLAAVRDGLRVIVFEQTGEALEQRLGFRVAEYGLRQAWARTPGHPLLAGIGEQHLHDWRGEATLLPPRLAYQRTQQFNFAPVVKWAGIPVTRVWRGGHRGSVASALIEKPARGDFLPVVDGGFSLQYTPLLEYREGQGVVLFCQLDVTGRTEIDPAAETLAGNLLRYAAAWRPRTARAVVYAGGVEGAGYLRAAGVPFVEYGGGPLSAAQVLVVAPGGGTALAARQGDVAAWLAKGGRAVALGLDGREASRVLPREIATAAREHIAAYFEPFGVDSPFAGISPAEVHNRDPREVPLVAGGASAAAGGVLARMDGADVVFSQLAPWQFDYSGERMNVKRTFRRVACLTARVLANAGAPGSTPLLDRFHTPARPEDKRWLAGLYLDIPEEWDDPYRFFRW